MWLFKKKKKNGLEISSDITAINGEVIVRKGERFNDPLLKRVEQQSPAQKETVPLAETKIFVNCKLLLHHPKYQFITNNGSKITQLLDLIAPIRFSPLLIEELQFMYRFEYRYRHSLTIALIATRMLLDFYQDADKAREAAACAITHDIGITRVPEAILNKLTPLNDDEQKILKEHPLYSSLLLAYYLGDQHHPNARIALLHHEDSNGTGYPRGIELNDIVAHCIHLCDYYDALVSARPFRPAMPPAKAWEIIAEKVEEGQLDRLAFTLLNAYLQNLD